MSLALNGRLRTATWLLTLIGIMVVAVAPRLAAAPRKPRRTLKASQPVTRAMSEAEARTAVAMLDDAYQLLLEETHATYHNRPSVPVAATVIRKLHTKMYKLGWPHARFVAVNAIVMHPDNVPRDRFERQAVQTLRRSNQTVERVEDGNLRVATVVPTGGACASCHWTPRGGQSSKAAITYNVPLVK